MKLSRKLICVAVLLLAACSTHSDQTAPAAPTTSLKSSIAVGQITGGGSWLFDPDAVRDSEFKDALQKALAAQGYLAADNATYKIEADITTHLTFADGNEERTAEESVDYRVVRLTDLKIFGETIKTSYSVPGYATTA